MLGKVDAAPPCGHWSVTGADDASGRCIPEDRQVLAAEFALALVREHEVQGLLAAACQLCRQALPISSFAVLEHSAQGEPDVARLSVDLSCAPGAAAGPGADARTGGDPAAVSLHIPGDGQPFGVLRVGFPGRYLLPTSDLAFLAVVAELLGAAITRLGQDEGLRRAHVRGVISDLQCRTRNDMQVLHGFARLQARQAPNMGRSAPGRSISRQLVPLTTLYDHLLDAGPERQVELDAYLRTLCTRIEAVEGLAGRGVALDARSGPLPVSLDVAADVGVALNELIPSAAERSSAGQDGRTSVRLTAGTAGAVRATLLVDDDGLGSGTWPDDCPRLSYVRDVAKRAGARIERRGSAASWRIDLH